MSPITRTLLHGIDWQSARTAVGNAQAVPQALAELFAAETDEEAKAAYWSHLDNEVVVQGELFEAAALVVGPILVELSIGSLSDAARYRAVELLVEIALGAPHSSEESASGMDVQASCTKGLRGGLWTIYSLLDCEDERVVVGALHVLDAVEENRSRLVHISQALAGGSGSDAVRARAAALLG